MKRTFKSLLVAGLLAGAGFAAYSQGPGGMMEHDSMGSMHHMGRMDPAKMDQMVARHLAGLKAKLKITSAQEAAWTTFAAAMKPPADMMSKRPDRAEMDKLSTPERIDKMRALRAQHMTDMTAAMDKRDEAIKTFYATLSPEQKKVFDAEHTRMGAGRHGGDHAMPKDAGAKAAPAAPGTAKP